MRVLSGVAMRTDSSTRLVATIRGAALAVLGAIVLGFAVIELMSIYAFVENARRTEERVVALTAGPAHSQVQFIDPHTGQQNTFPGNGLGASHRVGDPRGHPPHAGRLRATPAAAVRGGESDHHHARGGSRR